MRGAGVQAPPADDGAAAASPAPAVAVNKQQRAPWPGDKANPLSVLFLSWLNGLLWRGYRKPLEDGDIYAAPAQHSAESVRARVEAFRARHPTASFTSVIIRAFILRWLAGFASKCVFICAYLLQPFFVGALVSFIDDQLLGRYNDSSTYFFGAIHKGLHLAAGLTVTSLVAILVSRRRRTGASGIDRKKPRSSIMSILYPLHTHTHTHTGHQPQLPAPDPIWRLPAHGGGSMDWLIDECLYRLNIGQTDHHIHPSQTDARLRVREGHAAEPRGAAPVHDGLDPDHGELRCGQDLPRRPDVSMGVGRSARHHGGHGADGQRAGARPRARRGGRDGDGDDLPRAVRVQGGHAARGPGQADGRAAQAHVRFPSVWHHILYWMDHRSTLSIHQPPTHHIPTHPRKGTRCCRASAS